MRVLRFFLALALAVVIHLVGSRMTDHFTLGVDAFLVVAILFALRGAPVSGMFGGLAAGMAADALSGGPFGLYGIGNTIVGYGVAVAVRRLVIQRASGVFVVATIAAVVQQLIVLLLGWVLLNGGPTTSPVWLLVKTGTTGILAATAYVLYIRIGRRFGLWRESRSSRLRFGG